MAPKSQLLQPLAVMCKCFRCQNFTSAPETGEQRKASEKESSLLSSYTLLALL